MTLGTLRSIDSADVRGKTVLIRADLNVPMQDGAITDATRISHFAPTVSGLVNRGAAVVIATHLGRPKGEPNPCLSTRPIAQALEEALGRPVVFAKDCVGEPAESATADLQPGRVVVLENLRFHAGEMENSRNFAMRLSVNGDIYVNDAFSCAHRAHASTHAITDLMPSYAGPSLLAEVAALEAALVSPERPVVAVVGGAKVSTKIAVLKNLMNKLDAVIIGGGMANTFLYANGVPMGKSLHEADQVETVREIEQLAEKAGCMICLPTDVVVSREFTANAQNRTVPVDGCPVDAMILDAGPESTRRFQELITSAKTVLWNGPLGAFEIQPFDRATVNLARIAAQRTAEGALVSIAGGGDTVAALNAAGVSNDFTYVSTAGGAFLEWLEGKTLPGIAALMSANEAA
ncbi:phosphoglycerate kinase [Roseibium sp. TrichSKD4]|uniref:phosphoglycerate kinase n=1 Tax=Roseibium sp. TrichSKD4 TaxID=744980 RepID=UPI0001E5741B|nr:phosphoglycerate kinase [Roseibium sp. TrichSKD4]EFO29853.1 phosphoglycerate kinase [Roseibium sp. TrichSKD4]